LRPLAHSPSMSFYFFATPETNDCPWDTTPPNEPHRRRKNVPQKFPILRLKRFSSPQMTWLRPIFLPCVLAAQGPAPLRTIAPSEFPESYPPSSATRPRSEPFWALNTETPLVTSPCRLGWIFALHLQLTFPHRFP